MHLRQLRRGLWRARGRIVRAVLELSAAILEIQLSALTAGGGIHRGTKPCGASTPLRSIGRCCISGTFFGGVRFTPCPGRLHRGSSGAQRGASEPPAARRRRRRGRGLAPETPAGTRAFGAGTALGDRTPWCLSRGPLSPSAGSIHQPPHDGPVVIRSGVTRRSFCMSPPPGYVLCRTFPAGVAPSCRATGLFRTMEWQLTWANPDPGDGSGCCFLRPGNPPRHPCVL